MTKGSIGPIIDHIYLKADSQQPLKVQIIEMISLGTRSPSRYNI